MSKVLVVNSSPMMEKSTTFHILEPFMDGMKKAGAEVNLFFTRKMKINPCYGEFHCWIRHPGKCYQEDDMQEIYPLFNETDIFVIASPLYVDGLSGSMKMFIDRLIPMISPFIEIKDGRCRHLLPENHKNKKIVLVSSCGYYEKENFAIMVDHIKAICKNLHGDYCGALLRPHGAVIPAMKKKGLGIMIRDVLKSAEKAGMDLIRKGEIDRKTLERISKPLLPREKFLNQFNAYFERRISRAQKEIKQVEGK